MQILKRCNMPNQHYLENMYDPILEEGRHSELGAEACWGADGLHRRQPQDARPVTRHSVLTVREVPQHLEWLGKGC